MVRFFACRTMKKVSFSTLKSIVTWPASKRMNVNTLYLKYLKTKPNSSGSVPHFQANNIVVNNLKMNCEN